jgi:hypothetical protein
MPIFACRDWVKPVRQSYLMAIFHCTSYTMLILNNRFGRKWKWLVVFEEYHETFQLG